jgi:hypothetical protein
MANPNAPFGFRPVRSQSGAQKLSCNPYPYASNATRIGKGDLVVMDSSGNIKKETSATAVGPWVGIAMHDTGSISAAGTVIVCDDPNAVAEVQGPSAALALTDLNRIVKVNGAATVNTSTGLSGAKLTNTDASQSNGVRILRLANRPNNSFAAYQVLEVAFNARLSQSAGG